MKFGMVSLAWQSPFSDALGQFKLAKKYGCDIYEIVPEDWSTIDVDAINAAKAETGIETPTIPRITRNTARAAFSMSRIWWILPSRSTRRSLPARCIPR